MGVTKPRKPKKTNTGATILARMIKPEEASFSPEAARSILKLKFARADQEQVDHLSAKAREGTLTLEGREDWRSISAWPTCWRCSSPRHVSR